MKNNLHTTEELLEKGKNAGLSVSEHDDMRSALLSYARYHGVDKTSSKSRFSMSNVWIRGFVSVSLMLVLFVGTGYASMNSLPGERLYMVKTDVVEELTFVTKLTKLSQLEYHHELYETRLFELQTLSEKGQMSVAALKDSRSELSELSDKVSELMNNGDEIDDVVALELVGDMVAISNVTEMVVKDSGAKEQLDAFESITDELEQIHNDEVIDLLENGTSTIESYVRDQLTEISDELTENDLEEIIAIRIADHVENMEISLRDGDYNEVVDQLIDAVTLIQTKEYINDFNNEIIE